MAKKMLKKKVQRKPAAPKAAAPIVDSAREIWLAGLGAFSVAQQESGKIIEQGSKLFDKLVAEGSKIEKKTRKEVEGAVGDIRGEVESRVEVLKQQAEEVRKQATDNWDKLESIFESRVARAMGRLGMPSKDAVSNLADRVDELSRRVAALDAKAGSRKASPKKASARKAATKKAAPAKAAAKKTVSKKVLKKKASKPAAK